MSILLRASLWLGESRSNYKWIWKEANREMNKNKGTNVFEIKLDFSQNKK